MTRRERGLFPGTVDLVILRTLVEGPKHGFLISRTLRDRSDVVVDLQDAPCIRPSIALSARAGSRPSGVSRRRIGGPSSTA